jgi:hypothetical protein
LLVLGEATLLEQNLRRELRGATATKKLDRAMEIDVVARCESSGSAATVAGPLQLLRTPVLDPPLLGVFENVELGLAHRITSGSLQFFPHVGLPAASVLPRSGGYRQFSREVGGRFDDRPPREELS